jgi:hypothetical protein
VVNPSRLQAGKLYYIAYLRCETLMGIMGSAMAQTAPAIVDYQAEGLPYQDTLKGRSPVDLLYGNTVAPEARMYNVGIERPELDQFPVDGQTLPMLPPTTQPRSTGCGACAVWPTG